MFIKNEVYLQKGCLVNRLLTRIFPPKAYPLSPLENLP
jgi:hypothetical protein